MKNDAKTNQDLDFNKLAEMQKENREIMENLKQATEKPLFGNEDKFAQTIAEVGIKAAEATHEFNMKEIKAKLIADLCKELVKTPIRYEDVPKTAREIAEKALETATENANVSQIAKMSAQISVMQNILFAISQAIRDNKQPTEYTSHIIVNSLEKSDKQAFNDIIKFINEHIKTE